MEAHRRGFREVRVSGPSREKARAGCALSKSPTAAATRASGSPGRHPRGLGVDALRRQLPSEPLQRHAVEEPVRRPCRRARGARASRTAPAGREPAGSARAPPRQARRSGRLRAKSGWSRFPAVTAYAVSGSSSAADCQAAFAPSCPGPELRQAEIQLHRGALRVEARELRQARDRAVGPAAEGLRRSAPRASRGAANSFAGVGALARVVQAQASAQVARLASTRTPRSSESGGAPGRPAAPRPRRRRARRSWPR